MDRDSDRGFEVPHGRKKKTRKKVQNYGSKNVMNDVRMREDKKS